MPLIARIHGWRLFFYSNEGDPRERPHVHAQKQEAEAKFWLEPAVAIAYARGVGLRDLRELTRVVQDRRDDFIRSWHDYFGH